MSMKDGWGMAICRGGVGEAEGRRDALGCSLADAWTSATRLIRASCEWFKTARSTARRSPGWCAWNATRGFNLHGSFDSAVVNGGMEPSLTCVPTTRILGFLSFISQKLAYDDVFPIYIALLE